MTAPTRPVLRYYGGKWIIAPWIISFFPSHHVYVEPYGGAGSVLIRKPRSFSEVYNDLESEVVRVFRVLRDPKRAARLELVLRRTPYAREELELAQIREGDDVERARRAIVRSFRGFGSDTVTRRASTGFRHHSGRPGSTPAHDWAGWPNVIPAFVARLQGLVIEKRPAVQCVKEHDGAETLFYVDPPYVHASRRSFYSKHGYAHEMTDEDHRELADVLHSIDGMAIVSGYPSELYESLYADWQQARRPSRATGAVPSTEVLWISPRAEAQRSPLFAGGQ